MSTRCWMLLLILAALSTGCGRTRDPHAAWRETITQVSTMPAFARGHFDGSLAVSNLLARGDHGLGTFEGLGGELVLHRGVVYRVNADGVAQRAAPDERVAFAQVTWFEPNETYTVMAMNQRLFRSSLGWKQPDRGHAKAVRVTGRFKSITLRTLPQQTPPYVSFEEVLKTGEQVRTLENIDGVMIGFRAPDILGTVAPLSFYLHFISADGSLGGHVVDFEIAAGRIELDGTPEFHVLLPLFAR